MLVTKTSLALAVLLHLAQAEAPPSEPPAQAATQAPEDDPRPEEAPEKRELSRITLKDGQVLRGVVVRRDTQFLVLELAVGGRLELPAEMVKSVEAETRAQLRANGEVWFQDPNRTRYFYAPSGMMLRGGEGYFSQKELLFSSMNYGLTDNITLQAGAVVPAWLVPNGFNLIGGVKVGGSVTDKLHLAVGAQALILPGLMWSSPSAPAAAGFVFGTATYGTPDAHVSVAAGTPFLFQKGEDVLSGHIVTTLSGNLRLTRGLALVTENWLLPTVYEPGDRSLPMFNSLGVRIFGEHWAVDIGAIRVPQLPVFVPIPWLDFTYNFG
jgi:hypothetical protein